MTRPEYPPVKRKKNIHVPVNPPKKHACPPRWELRDNLFLYNKNQEPNKFSISGGPLQILQSINFDSFCKKSRLAVEDVSGITLGGEHVSGGPLCGCWNVVTYKL